MIRRLWEDWIAPIVLVVVLAGAVVAVWRGDRRVLEHPAPPTLRLAFAPHLCAPEPPDEIDSPGATAAAYAASHTNAIAKEKP
jgi:hypothetical protein